jgi:hypothetical protein
MEGQEGKNRSFGGWTVVEGGRVNKESKGWQIWLMCFGLFQFSISPFFFLLLFSFLF